MEYPFKDLMPLNEATARDGYYRDWTHIDADTFHQISELAKFIREKGHGADTREAIAQALERVYHDAAQSGNANMEVSQARGSYPNLNSRLDDVDNKQRQTTTELAEKAPYSTIWSMANMGQDVKEAMTNGSVAVVGKNAVLKENIVEKQVTPTKLSGHDNTDAQNVIDKDDLIRGGWVSYETGEVIEGTSQSGFNCYSIYYPVIPGERWYKNDASQAVIYDSQKNRVSAVDRTSRIVDIPDDGRFVRLSFVYEDTELYFSKVDYYTEPTFKIKHLEIDGKNVVGKLSIDQMDFIVDHNLFDGQFTNEWYMDVFDNTLRESTNELVRTVVYEINPLETIYIGIEGDHNRFRAGLVDSLSHLAPFTKIGETDVSPTSLKVENTHYKYLVIQVSNQGDEPNLKISTKPIKSTGNISIGRYDMVTKDELTDFIDYNLFDVTYLDSLYPDPVMAELREPTSVGTITAVIEVDTQTTVYIKINEDHNRFRVALGHSKELLSPIKIVTVDDDNSSPKSIEVNTENYTYLFVQVSNIGQTPNLIVSNSFSLTVCGLPVALKSDLEHIDTNTEKYATYFERELQPVDILPSHTDVYGLWDDIQADFPNHLTKTLLGVNAQGNELYECKITMPQIPGVSKRRFKLGITCGMHGDEYTPVYSIIDFVKELLENPNENELLNSFKANIDLHIIPICNPTGYDANTRSNGQGVDLNRNFTDRWEPGGTRNVGYTTFSGDSPASELETQILEQWLADNEFDYVIDFHNGNPTNEFSYAVLDSRDIDAGDVYIRTLPKLSNAWAKRFPNLPQNKQYGYVTVSDASGLRAQAISTGATALTLEAGHTMYGMDSAKYGQYAQTFSKDLIFNYLAELHKVLFG